MGPHLHERGLKAGVVPGRRGAAVLLVSQVDACGAVQLLQLVMAALLLNHPAGKGAAGPGPRARQGRGPPGRPVERWVWPSLRVPCFPSAPTHPQTHRDTHTTLGIQKVLNKCLIRKADYRVVVVESGPSGSCQSPSSPL